MAIDINRDPDLEWLDHVPQVGLVVAPTLLKELGLIPSRQSAIETGEVAEIIGDDLATPASVACFTPARTRGRSPCIFRRQQMN